LGCRRRIEVRESSDLTTAATIGWRRPVILLPCQWTAWTAEQRRAVLAHEIAHVGRNDFLAVLCGQLGLVPHFYHPLLHWLMARLRLEQELAADAAAAVVTGGQRQYLVTIAELALHQQDRPLAWPARSFLPTQTTFLRRIAMLRDARVRSDRLSPTARTLAVGAVLVCGLVVAGLRGPVGQLQSLAQEAKRAAADLESDARAKELTGIDLTYVPEDAVGILAWRPAAIFRQPGPAQYASILADVLPRAPTPITEIEQFTIVVLRAAEKKPPALPDALAIYQTLKPYDFQAVLRRMHKAARKEYEGKVYYVEIMGTPPGFVLGNVVCQLDDRTLVQGSSEETLKKLISGRKGLPKFIDAKVWKAFEPDHAVVAVEASTVAQIVRMTQPPSAAALLSTFSPLWQDSTCGVGGLRVGRELKVHAVAVVTSKTQFRNVSKTVDALLTFCSNAAREARAAASHEKKAEHEASSVLVLEVVARIFANMHIQTEADNVISVEGSVSMDTIRNLLPPITDARRASDRTRSVNNLKHIAIAMHNYHDKYKCFPPAVLYGPDGKTPYSWRVAILPFLEQAALYKHYRFDEPWDGPNNRRLAEIRVPVFHCPSEIARSANASYFALVGPGTVFEKKDRAKPSGVPKSPVAGSPGPRIETDGISFTEIRDGTSNTLMIVEAKRNIPWSKPEDIPYDPKKPIPELGGYFEGGFHAARCDGAVFFLPNSIAEATLRAMISRNGREVIDWRKEVGKR